MGRLKRHFERKPYKKLNKVEAWLFSALAAIGIATAPVVMPEVEAGEIYRSSDTNKATNLLPSGTANIYAEAASRGIGVNSFSTFKVSSGDIANMHFATENAKGTPLNSLVNIVTSRIDVNGTVNAIRANKIDGHMFFLSKDGMVVGNSGVINAGQLTVIAPKKDFEVDTGDADSLKNFLGDNTSLGDFDNVLANTIALNEKGTIVVKGTINTAGGVDLRATSVQVGDAQQNASNTGNVGGKQPNGIIRTGIDFKHLVNTNNLNLNNLSGSAVNAALIADKETGNYKLTFDTDSEGNEILKNKAYDIVAGDASVKITAENTYKNYRDNDLALIYNLVSFSGDNTIRADVSLAQGSEISALGDVSISATASNDPRGIVEYWGYNASEWTIANTFNSGVYAVRADINVDGDVQGRNVEIAADSSASFDNGDNKGRNLVTSLYDTVLKDKILEKAEKMEDTLDFFDAVGIHAVLTHTKAEVKVGADSTINAYGDDSLELKDGKIKTDENGINEGGALRITAVSSAEAKVEREIQNSAYDDAGKQKTNTSDIVNLVGVYGGATSEAKVTVEGTLETEGAAVVAAKSVADAGSNAAIARPAPLDKDPGQFSSSGNVNLSAAITRIDNNATVEFLTDSSLNAGGRVQLASGVTDSIAVKAKVATDENALINIGAGLALLESNNKVDIDGSIVGSEIDVTASEVLKKSNVTINSSVGSDDAGMWKKVSDFETKVSASKFMTYLTKPIETILSGGYQNQRVKTYYDPDSISRFGDVGVTFGLEFGNVKSDVIIGENGSLKSTGTTENAVVRGGDININSTTVTKDSYFSVQNTISNKDTRDASPKLISGSVGVMDLDAKANITIAGREEQIANDSSDTSSEESGEKPANAIQSVGALSLNASSKHEYGRWDAQLKTIEGVWEKLFKIKGIREEISKLADDYKALRDYYANIEDADMDKRIEMAAKEEKAWSDLYKLGLIENVQEVQDIIAGLPGTFRSLIAPSNYVQFYVANSTAQGMIVDRNVQKQLNSKFAFAGAVGVNNLSNAANIVIGKNSELVAAKDLSMNADTSRTNTAIYGKVVNSSMWILPKPMNADGAENGFGVTVGIDSNDLLSTIAVAENAKLSGDSVALNTNNYAKDMALTFGGASGVNDSGSGMVHVMGGNSNALILADDESKLLAVDKLSIGATNTIEVYNLVGDFNRGAAVSVGFGVGVMDYDVHTIAGIADNDFDNTTEGEDKKYTNRKDGEVEDLLDLVKTNLSDDLFNDDNFGSVDTTKTGEVKATELSVDAHSTGKQNVFAVAGVASGTTRDFNGVQAGAQNTLNDRYIANANANTGWQITTAGSVAMTIGENETASLLEGTNVTITPQEKTKNDETKLVGSVKLSAKDDIYTGAYSGGVALSQMSSSSMANKEFALSGAAAFNKIDKKTVSQIKGASINNALEVSNKAENSGAQVAIGLGIGADKGGKDSRPGADLAMSGSVNLLDTEVHANILDTSMAYVPSAASTDDSGNSNQTNLNAPTVVTNLASDEDLQVSGGLTIEYSKASGALGADLGLLVAKNDVQAVIGNTNANTDKAWNNVGAIQNYAASKLNQVNGAVSVGLAAGENSKFSGNAAIVINDIDNTVKADVNNANITAKSLDNRAFDGFIAGETTENSFVETLKTQTKDKYNNVQITRNEQGDITNVTYDKTTETTEIDTDGSKIAKAATENGNGESTLQTLDTSAGGVGKLENVQDPIAEDATSVKVLREGLYTSETLTVKNDGNKQVGFAVSGALRNSEQGGLVAGAAAVRNTFKNTFDSSISGGSINLTGTETTDVLNVEAKSNTSMTGFAAGVAFDNKQTSGAVIEGSGIGQNITNTINAKIENATITTSNSKVDVKADNAAELLAIAGQAAVTGGTNLGLGLAVAKNTFNNTTGAYIYGSDIIGSDNGLDVNVIATNNQQSSAWAIGGTYNQEPEGMNLTAQGTFALNTGKNNTEAIVDESKDANNQRLKTSKIKKAGNVSVTTKDESALKAVAGAISAVKGNVALGGAWAENTAGTDKNKQNNTAAIRNTEISHVAKAENATPNKVTVKAEDIANATAIGIAGSGSKSDKTILAAEGTIAINKQYKNINAELVNSVHDVALNGTFETNKHADLEVHATSTEKNITSADGIGANIGGNAAVGAGAAYNTSDIDTKAELSNSAIAADNVKVLADNNNQALNIGIGASVVSNTNAATNISGDIEFNLADNSIDNDVTAKIENSTILANDNVVVDANGHEKITNFIGGLGVNFSGTQQFMQISAGAGVGLNSITSDVAAKVIGSNITALGKGAAYDVTEYNGTEGSDGKATGELAAGVTKNLKGLVVNAKGDHDLWNLVLNAGFIVSTSGSTIRPNVNMAIAKNTIAGSTTAMLEDTNVNAFYTSAYTGEDRPKDVYVNAYDNTDVTNNDIGISGTFDLGENTIFGLTAGAAGSTNDITRNVSAAVTTKDNTPVNVNADKLKVKALSHSDIYTADAGVAVDFDLNEKFQLANSDVVSYINNSYNTTAFVKNTNSYNGGMSINADIVEKARAKGVGINLSVGNFDYHKPSLSVDVGIDVLNLKNGNRTEAGLINSNITHFGNADDVIKANSNVKLEAIQGQGSAAVAIYGGALNALFTDSDIDDFTGVTIAGSNIGNAKDDEHEKAENKANSLVVEANSKLKGEFNNGSGAVGTLVGISGMENFTKVDTYTVVNVSNSQLYADDIDVNAKENLDVQALEVGATVGAANLSVNKAHVNFGTGVSNEYKPVLTTNDSNFSFGNVVFSISDTVGKINGAQTSFNEQLKKATDKEVKSLDGETTASTKHTGTAKTFSNGGVGQAVTDLSNTNQAGNQGTKVNISNSLLKSTKETNANNANTKDVNVSAERTINAKLDVGQGTLEIVGGTLAYAEITDKRSVGVSLNNSTIDAKSIGIDSKTNSTLDSTVVQAALDGVNYSHVDSSVEISGENVITLNNATLYGNDAIDVFAKDSSIAENHTVDAGLQIVAGGYLLNEIKDTSNTGVNVSGSTLSVSEIAESAEMQIVTGTGSINIDAERNNYQNSRITIGGLKGISGQGAYSKTQQGEDYTNAPTKGISYVNLAGNNTLLAEEVNLSSENQSSLRAVSTFAGVDLVNLFGGNYTYGNAFGGSKVDVANSNSIYTDELNVDAIIDGYYDETKQEFKKSIDSHAQRVNALAAVDVALTKAEAISKQTAAINFNADKVYGKELTGFKGDDHIEYIEQVNTDVYLNADNYTDMLAKTNSVTAVGVFAFGANKSVAENKNKTEINIGDGIHKGLLELNSLDVSASNKVTSMDDSYGLVAVDGIAIKPYGAHTVNDSQSEAIINVNNDIRTVEEMDIVAQDYNVIDFSTVSTKGYSAVDLGGNGKFENTVNNAAKVNIKNANLLSGGEMNIDADTAVDLGKDEDSYFASTTGVNIVGIGSDTLTNSITQTSQVNITNSNLASNDELNISAYSDDYIHIMGRNDTAFAVFGKGTIQLTNTITTNNNVKVDAQSKIGSKDSTEDVTIAAWDDIELNVDVAATDSGLLDGVSSTLKNVLTRNNTVDVSGSIYGMNDINLYAGKRVNGALSNMFVDMTAMASNYSLSSFSDLTYANIDNNITQNNKVNINGGASVTAMRDVELYAGHGTEYISAHVLRYKGIGFNVDDTKVYRSSQEKNDTNLIPVRNDETLINGNVVAGKANNVNIVIGTDKKQAILLTEEEKANITGTQGGIPLQGATDLEIYVNDSGENIQVGENGFVAGKEANTWTNGDFKLSVTDYGNQLQTRLEELKTLASEYSADRTSTAYIGYIAEIQRIEGLMESMGLLVRDSNGSIISGGTASLDVPTITLPDIVAGGGNITVTTDFLHGSGSMEAKGSPVVNITNNTNLMLDINDIQVQHAGGQINYNNQIVTGLNTGETGEGKSKSEVIGEINKKSGHEGTVANVKAQNTSVAGVVNITGNWTDNFKYSITQDGTTHTGILDPLANILVNGKIYAEDGTVNITSLADSVVLEGGAIHARNVNINAAKGGLYQGFVNGILTTAGNGSVEADYQAKVDQIKGQFGEDQTKAITYDNNLPVRQEDNSKYILGENIYISAADINVNSTIQSGFGKYELNINDDDATKTTITNIISDWQSKGSVPLEDYEVTSKDEYKIVTGGTVKDADGSYKMTLSAYYNPYTNKIIVEDVNANGGKIFLTGRVSSTGNGKLIAADGAYDITVNNALQNITLNNGQANEQNIEIGLQLGNLLVNDSEGLISILDTGNKTKTEIRRNRTDVYNMNLNYSDTNTEMFILDETKSQDSAIANYNPLTGLRYNWSSGETVGTTTYYKRVDDESWWGWFGKDKGSEKVQNQINTKLSSWETNADGKTAVETSGSATDPATKAKKAGTYIGETELNPDMILAVVYDKNTVSSERSDVVTDVRKHGFLNFYTDYEVKWSTYDVASKTYTASAKADLPISIKFAGNADGQSTVAVTSQSAVDIAGEIGNKKLYVTEIPDLDKVDFAEKGKVNITSSNGDIKGIGGNIYGEEVNLKALGNIENIKVLAGDKVNLSAIVTNTDNFDGLVDVEVIASAGAKGNVELGSASADSTTHGTGVNPVLAFGGIGANQVTLKASGDITNIVNTGVEGDSIYTNYVQGQRIDLTSTNGGVGVLTDTASHAVEGNLRSVSLNIEAALAIYAEQKNNGADAPDIMHVGKIYSSGGSVTLKSPGKIVDALEYKEIDNDDSVSALIDKWTDFGIISDSTVDNSTYMYGQQKIVDEYVANVTALFNEYTNASDEFKQTERYNSLKLKFGSAASVADYLATDAHYAKIKVSNLGINKDLLLYSIQDAIINKDPENLPKSSSKTPNIRGNNINLIAGDSVGMYDENITKIFLGDLNALNTADKESEAYQKALENLRILSRADASTVEWHLTKDEQGHETYSDDSYAIVNTRLALGIQTNDENGLICIDTSSTPGSDIFVEGRIESEALGENNKVINLNEIKTDVGDIYVSSLGDIVNGHNIDTHGKLVFTDAAIQGRDLVLHAAGDIGSAQRVMTTDINGALSVVANGKLYLEQISDEDLGIRNISATDKIFVQAKNDIYMYNEPGEDGSIIQGYIYSKNDKGITIVSQNGSIGGYTEDEAVSSALRIKNSNSFLDEKTKAEETVYVLKTEDDATVIEEKTVLTQDSVVTLAAAEDIIADGVSALYPQGVTKDNPKGEAYGKLNVRIEDTNTGADEKLENVSLDVNGYLNLMDNIDAAESINLNSALGLDVSKSLTATNITGTSEGDINLMGGNITGTNVRFEAGNSSDFNLKAGTIEGANVNIKAGDDTNLHGRIIVSDAANAIVSVEAGDDVNLQGGTIYASAENADVNIKAGNKVVQTYNNEEATGQVIEAANLKVQAAAGIDLGNAHNKLQNVALYNEGKDGETDYEVIVGNGGSANLNITAIGKSEQAMSDIALGIEEKRLAGNVTIVNYDDIPNDASTDNDVLVSGNIYTTGNLTIVNNETGAITSENVNIDAGQDVIINSNNGSIDNKAAITAGNDAIINAGTTISNSGNMDAGNDAIINAGTTVNNSGNVKASNDASIIANEDVTNNGDITAQNNANLIANNITNSGVLIAGNNATISAEGYVDNQNKIITEVGDVVISAEDYVENISNVTAGENVVIIAKNNIINKGDVSAANDAIINAGTSVANEGDMHAGGNADIDAGAYVYNNGQMTAGEVAFITAGSYILNQGDMIAENDVVIDAGTGLDNRGHLASLTDGNVAIVANDSIINSGVLEAQHGSVTIISNKGLVDNEDSADLFAGKGNVIIEAKDSIFNKGDLAANGNIILESIDGDVHNEDKFEEYVDKDGHSYSVSTNSVTIYALNGKVENTQNIIAAGDVDIEAKEGLANFAYDVITGGDINLVAKEGNLVNNTNLLSESGNITLEAEKGTVVNLLNGDIIALGLDDKSGTTGGNVTMKAGGAADSTPYLVANSDFGSYTKGEVIGTLEDFNVNIPEGKDENIILLSVFNGESTDIYIAETAGGNGKTKIGSVPGNVDVFRKGDVVNRGDIVAMGQTSVDEATGNVITVVPGRIDIESANGNVTNYDDFYKVDDSDIYEHVNNKFLMSTGSISLKAPEGYFYNNFGYSAGGDLILESSKGMTIGDDFSVGEVGGNLSVTSTHGDIVNGANLVVGKEATFVGQNITSNGSVTAGDHILMDAVSGDLIINGNVKNDQGGIDLYAKHSDKEDVTDGIINISQDVVAGGDGVLRVYAELKEQELSQELVDAVIASGELKSVNGSVDIGAVNGNVNFKDATVDAGNMAAVGTKNGNILLGEVSAGTVVLYNEDADNSVQTGKLTISEGVVVHSAKPVIKEVEFAPGTDHVTVDVTGAEGKVDPTGEFAIGDMDSKVDFDIANMAVGTAKVKTAGNINIGNLYVNGSETTEIIGKEHVGIESLATKDKVYTSSYGYDTSVFGSTPEYDGSQAIYFDDSIGSVDTSKLGLDVEKLFFDKPSEQGEHEDKSPAINAVLEEMQAIKQNGPKGEGYGMKLSVADSRNQSSNGLLLHVDKKHYVHKQRYSGESLSKILADYKAVEDYERYDANQVLLYERYNLYELPAFELVGGQLKNTLVGFVLADDKKAEDKQQ